MKVIINTARTFLQGEVVKGGKKLTDEYTEQAAYCQIHPEDAALIDVKEGDNISLKSAGGEVFLKSKITDEIQRGCVMIPLGPWANRIIGSYTFNTGSPYYKGNVGEIEKTNKKVKNVFEIMKLYKK
ncbi:MAG: molybdopterin dinucleotide binding domain-containing protein [Candidatus Hydrothermarchaeales archaeon]